MILAFSTSSKMASVALISPEGEIIFSGSELAERKASEVCLSLLEKSPIDLTKVDLFLADLGPGSFTGTRVGVMLAKTFAYTYGKLCGGADAFDLIAPDQTVVFPSKRDEWFVRAPGQLVVRSTTLPDQPFVGFGPGIEDEIFPDAARFSQILESIEKVSPVELIPQYLMEPAISTPKKQGVLPR